MEIEYIGEVLPDGRLSLDPAITGKLKAGQKFRVKLEGLDQDYQEKTSSSLSEEAQDFLSYLRNAVGRGGYQEQSITRAFIHDNDR